jgi:hypothetical protein
VTTKQNPSVYKDMAGKFSISFKVNNGYSDPLWLTEQGLKNLAKCSLNPKEFTTEAEATCYVREVLNPLIIHERGDGALIKGW